MQMKLLSTIFKQVLGVGAIALVVLFQQEIRKFLILIGIKSYNSKFNLDYYMDLLKANRNRQLIYQELVNYYSSNQVFFGPVLPYHASMSEIILCVNKNGEALDIPSEFRSNLESGHQICKPPLSKLALGKPQNCRTNFQTLNTSWFLDGRDVSQVNGVIFAICIPNLHLWLDADPPLQ